MFNGAPYECNPKVFGLKQGPCCSASGFCGNTTKHCECSGCVDYNKKPGIEQQFNLFVHCALVTYPGPWRKDGRCGDRYRMSHGAPYQCNPAGNGPRKGPCCSANGFCGNTAAHCTCPDCVDYGKVKGKTKTFYKNSNKQYSEPWRSDGRCGKKFKMFNGKPFECNPTLSGPRKGPCCSAAGYCGDSSSHCSCPTCVDYSKKKDKLEENRDYTENDQESQEDGADATEPDLEAKCKAASEADEELHNEYCELGCSHTMCKYPVSLYQYKQIEMI